MDDQPPVGVDVVVITALELEESAVLRQFADSSPEPVVRGRRAFHRCRPQLSDGGYADLVVMSLPGMGNVEAAVATTHAIYAWNPRLIMLAGIAGGVKRESVQLGDVVVAEQILAHEPGKLTDGELRRRYKVLRPAFRAMEAARNLPNEDWHQRIDFSIAPEELPRRPLAHFGVVASGEKVIADEEFVSELGTHWSELAAVEMEGYGTAVAAYEAETAPGMVLVKAICDWADSTKNDAWREFAAECAAAYVRMLVRSLALRDSARAHERGQALRGLPVRYSGQSKIVLCRRLGPEWADLADYFDVSPAQRAPFPKGRECQGLWEWLQRRNKLEGLEAALRFIERSDLLDELGLG